jgi:hypothetical protein
MQTHDTGAFMKQLWMHMSVDAKNATGGIFNASHYAALKAGNVATFRSIPFPGKFRLSVDAFKWQYQLETLLKRYCFANDVYTQDELKEKTIKSFIQTQERLCNIPIVHTITKSMVISNARKIVKTILGSYDPSVHHSLCRFGTNAAVGIPFSKAYLDERMAMLISGSAGHIDWFTTDILPKDNILADCIHACQTKKQHYTQCEALQLTCVPKSYKAYRGIMPNTQLGGFYSNGLGDYITERLLDAGINISNLQMKHQRWAKMFSSSRTHVTADLSAASDSFTSELVNKLVPRAWYNALKLGRIQHANVGGQLVYMTSFMSMGIGFTFPLQTLLFYALIKAIGAITDTKGLYSVYGDDLIYPRKIHNFVVGLFPSLGFILNEDKTYAFTHFRESCGGDYYRGVDVRPFNPEGESQRLARQPYVMFLYRVVNGLRRRWHECEIPVTLHFLKREILSHDSIILQVPPSYPDDSGWKVDKVVRDMYFFPVVTNVKIYGYSFNYYSVCADLRVALHQFPYYWDWLRDPVGEPSLYTRARDTLRWKQIPSKVTVRSKYGTHTHIRRTYVPHTASKSKCQFIRQTGSQSDWT